MSIYDHKYRDGVRAYILSLDPKAKKEFEYRLYQDVNIYRKQFREVKESLKEAVEALAFLQAEMYVIPFKKLESGTKVALTDEGESETVEEKRRRA